jgi:hypothetical protein
MLAVACMTRVMFPSFGLGFRVPTFDGARTLRRNTDRLDQARVIVLDVADPVRTGQQVISSDG